MEKHHQRLLERNYITLLNDMDVEHVRDCMKTSDLFGVNCEEVQRIDLAQSKQEKARIIIESLMRKGARAFEFFVNALNTARDNQQLALTLASEGNIPLYPRGMLPAVVPPSREGRFDRAQVFGDRPTVHAMPVTDRTIDKEAELVFGHRCLTIRLVDDDPL